MSDATPDAAAARIAALEAELEGFRTLLGAHDSGYLIVYDAEGRQLHDSPSLRRLMGPQLPTYRPFAGAGSIIHPEDQARVGAHFARVRDDESAEAGAPIEYRWRLPDGRELWVEARARAIRNPHGQVTRVLAAVRNITGRMRDAERLRESEARLRLLTDHASDYIFLYDRTGQVIYDSPSFQRLLGEHYAAFARRQLAGETSIVHPEDRAQARAMLEAGIARTDWTSDAPPTTATLRWQLPSGEVRWVETHASPALDAEQRLAGIVVIARDITERRNSERKVQELQRMEAIGQLTGGLAHDFNNLLGVVVGNLDLIGERLGKDAGLRRPFDTALQAALRGAEVTRALLAVARRQPMEVNVQDLNALVGEMEPLLRSSAGSSVAFSTELWAAPLEAKLDAPGFSNVVLNLVINARDAMAKMSGGRRLALRTRAEPGFALLEVEDNGEGMSEEVRARALEPFFTTKERGKGTGLGLATVQGYAAQLGGSLEIDSAPGAGARVRLRLPLATGAAAADGAPEAAGAAGEHRASGLRVLVVDDEEGLRELACAWLSALGHTPVPAESPAPALERLGEGFDLLFTDVVMPGPMDGIALAREALRRQPRLRVLIASGYAQSLIDQAHALPGPLLNKPYRKPDLARALQEALGASAKRT